MFGEQVIKANKNLWRYLAAREAEDAARRAAAPPAQGAQAGPPEPPPRPAVPPADAAPGRRRYASILPWEEDIDVDDFGV